MSSRIPPVMKGVFISEFSKPYQIRNDIPTPKLTNPNNMIVQIKAAGFCHTELMAKAGVFGGEPGFVPGHEPCGIVVAVGSNVTKFKPGDRVGCGLFRDSCGSCRECRRGTTNYCASSKLGGLTVDGGMAEYYLADPNWAVRLPDEMPFSVGAPLMCAGSTIYNCLKRAQQPKGAIVAIIGIGGLGHLGVQFAKSLGYRVVAVDTRRAPIDLVMSLPERFRPDLVLNPIVDKPEAAIAKITQEFGEDAIGIDAALVATEAVPAFAYARGILAKHGTLVFIGQPDADVPFHFTDFIVKDLTIVPGCLGQPSVVQEMVDLVQREGIEVHTTLYRIEEIEKLLSDYEKPDAKGKFVVTFE